MLTDNGGGEGTDEAMGDRQEDVFGNPMMLSMLICYLQPSKAGYVLGSRPEAESSRGPLLHVDPGGVACFGFCGHRFSRS